MVWVAIRTDRESNRVRQKSSQFPPLQVNPLFSNRLGRHYGPVRMRYTLEEQTNTVEPVNWNRSSDRDKHGRHLLHVSLNAGSEIIFAAMPLKLH